VRAVEFIYSYAFCAVCGFLKRFLLCQCNERMMMMFMCIVYLFVMYEAKRLILRSIFVIEV
jgi:hypothetical protein